MADTITVSGTKLAKLSRLSPWIRERADEQGGKTLVIRKKDFPRGKGTRSKWHFLSDIASGQKPAYVEADGKTLVVDKSKGYTRKRLESAADYFIIGKKGDEMNALVHAGIIGRPQKSLSHGDKKPRATLKHVRDPDWDRDHGYGGTRRRRRRRDL